MSTDVTSTTKTSLLDNYRVSTTDKAKTASELNSDSYDNDTICDLQLWYATLIMTSTASTAAIYTSNTTKGTFIFLHHQPKKTTNYNLETVTYFNIFQSKL